MTLAKIGGPDYDARIRRAQHLGASHPFAAEVMNFYQHLAQFQKRLYARLAQPADSASRTSVSRRLPFASRSRATPLATLPRTSLAPPNRRPAPVAEAARQLSAARPRRLDRVPHRILDRRRQRQPSRLATLLTQLRTARSRRRSPHRIHPPESFSQPYAEFLAANRAAPPPSPPILSARSAIPPRSLGVLRIEGDGGKRHLLCSFCLHEWEFRRILCPTCGEEAENKLPVYVAEQFPHIRVEACDTCRYYIRTIDLTKDGHAIPLVDDLAALPLTLWATEHNYSRLHPTSSARSARPASLWIFTHSSSLRPLTSTNRGQRLHKGLTFIAPLLRL